MGKIIALAGNPNVGKSTVFNALTGLRQHTGNWAGKTVANARGTCLYNDESYTLVDLPGCYSLMAHSPEEEVARDFLCIEKPDAVIVVCDATCLERNLNLVLQTIEITPHVAVCVNLMDEARKKKINVDLDALSEALGVPVVGAAARSGEGLNKLMEAVNKAMEVKKPRKAIIDYPICTDDAEDRLRHEDEIVTAIVRKAEEISKLVVTYSDIRYDAGDRKVDNIIASKLIGFPLMLLMLLVIFWITISGANYPSQLISTGLFWVEARLLDFFKAVGAPVFVYEMLVLGVYRVLAWVISVMLPPMAIFFPLFTLLEDVGYLPRVAFNLDRIYKKCNSCGKQALTMCMGFGCNAVGVTGCRIIDSPRERLIAIITNNFVPCNGRFPTLIALISMFFVGTAAGFGRTVFSAALLTLVILFGIVMTFVVSRALSATILKGVPSSFTLELPPYRRPQFGKVIVRSIFDRTLFVLGRAVTVAAPAGLVIWLMANVMVGELSLLAHFSGFLDPFARLIGMDGVILMAFILGFPANEIVIPIIIMAYMAKGNLVAIENLSVLKQLLVDNGWTWVTAASVMLFSLMHWPCSTTCLTIKKETKSLKWTAVSVAVPTAIGIIFCFLFSTLAKLL